MFLAGDGCQSDHAGDPDAGPLLDSGGGGGDGDGGAPIELAGELTVLDGGGLGHNWFAPIVFGEFPDGGQPIWHQETLRAGSCRLLRYQPGFCDRCEGVCVAPDMCRPWPQYRSAGTITVTGLTTESPLVLEPGYLNRYQSSGGLPDPLFEPDATITARAAGADIDRFALEVRGVKRLTIPAFDAQDRAVLEDGADLELAWSDVDDASRVHVFIHSGGQFHGIPPADILECDGPDSGALTIPRAAIEQLPVLGEGCAKMRDCAKFGIMRYRRVTTEVGRGTIALTVGSGTNYIVIHNSQ